MPGFNYKRALVLACAVLGLYILLRSTRTPEVSLPINRNSPPPIGTYDEIRRVVDWNEPQKPTDDTRAAAYTAKPDGGRTKTKQLKPQIPIDDLRGHPLRKQLANLYPYDVTSKFPAYIWQTWKDSPSTGKFPENYRPLEASWSVLHPTFVHEVITDDVASYLVRHLYASLPEVYDAYMALPEAVLKADFFRYLILLARGGIYSDIDTLALQSAVDWVPENVPRTSYGLIVGIEADPDRPDWKEWYSRRIQFCQWTIQSKPGHPVLVDVVASIVEETLQRQKNGSLKRKASKDIIEFTGPALWTDAIFKYFNDPAYFDLSTGSGNITWETFTGMTQTKRLGDVIVLPITSFSPGVGQMGAKEETDPMAFVKHSFEGTWKPDVERHVHGEDIKGQWDDAKEQSGNAKKSGDDKKDPDDKNVKKQNSRDEEMLEKKQDSREETSKKKQESRDDSNAESTADRTADIEEEGDEELEEIEDEV